MSPQPFGGLFRGKGGSPLRGNDSERLCNVICTLFRSFGTLGVVVIVVKENLYAIAQTLISLHLRHPSRRGYIATGHPSGRGCFWDTTVGLSVCVKMGNVSEVGHT